MAKVAGPGMREEVMRLRSMRILLALLGLLAFCAVSPNQIVQSRVVGERDQACELVSLQIAVLTMNRGASLLRLLTSLSQASYGCATVDLLIAVDKAQLSKEHTKVLAIATEFRWQFGRKLVLRRVKQAGLSLGWFELPYSTNHDYLAIFEDDMQVNPHFYTFFTYLHAEGVLSGRNITGMCLHPDDWELHVAKNCNSHTHSPYLYESPEPCNWGPIWKTTEWSKYVDWVISLKDNGELPYIREDIALNWNLYLHEGQDVQSSWVWKYNWLYNKVQIRYTFKHCDSKFTDEIFFAINHKEPGAHFKRKRDINNDPKLLVFNCDLVLTQIAKNSHGFKPAPFPGYKRNMKSMHG